MIIAPEITSDYFTWTGNTGVADVTAPGISSIVGRRFYDDAADEGFIVISKRTGTRVVFYHETRVLIGGDLLITVYTSVCGRFEIHILND